MSYTDLALAARRAFPAALLERSRSFAVALVVPLLLLVLWALASARGWMPQQILPPPIDVWRNFIDIVGNGELAQHASISAVRVLAGFLLGSGLGLVLGIPMGLSQVVEDYVKPLFTAIAQVPTLGWIPLLMLFLGIGEALKIVVIAKAALVPMVLNTAAGIRGIPVSYREVAQVFRFSRAQALCRLVLPAAVPPIFTGIRYSLTKAWTALCLVWFCRDSQDCIHRHRSFRARGAEHPGRRAERLDTARRGRPCAALQSPPVVDARIPALCSTVDPNRYPPGADLFLAGDSRY